MPISEADLENALKKKFPDAQIAFRDLAGELEDLLKDKGLLPQS